MSQPKLQIKKTLQ